ncbi:transposase [Pseudomonas sp. NFACC46-3]|uniref:IS110 family transposase n=1 Tax=unclassified Pseudomonas TaxID=196821 RepID=UPI000B0BE681
MAIEACNIYHQKFADLAHAGGCVIHMVGGYELSHYRKGVNVRAKTDALDARLLARYLKTKGVTCTPEPRRLISLLRRRAPWFRLVSASSKAVLTSCCEYLPKGI